jgi:hypothetical protein
MQALPVALTPVGASAFKHLVVKLGLSPKQYQDSTVLREWVQKNKNYRYVPSELLQAWGLRVDTGYEISRDCQLGFHALCQNGAKPDSGRHSGMKSNRD